MKSLAKTSLLVLVLIGLTATTASAQPYGMRVLPPVAPVVPPGPPIPVLGFHSYNTGGGELVTSVHWGSTAAQMGLEPNDIIVRANGLRLTHRGAWYHAMRRAAHEGVVRLTIIDCRTGFPVHRTHYLDCGPGGATLKAVSSAPKPRPVPRTYANKPAKKHPRKLVAKW